GPGESHGPIQRPRQEVVKVKDLADYVHTHVDRWADRCRKTRQTPVLLGQKGEDFPLRHLVKGEPRLPGEPEASAPEPADTKTGETAPSGAKDDAAGSDKGTAAAK